MFVCCFKYVLSLAKLAQRNHSEHTDYGSYPIGVPMEKKTGSAH